MTKSEGAVVVEFEDTLETSVVDENAQYVFDTVFRLAKSSFKEIVGNYTEDMLEWIITMELKRVFGDDKVENQVAVPVYYKDVVIPNKYYIADLIISYKGVQYIIEVKSGASFRRHDTRKAQKQVRGYYHMLVKSRPNISNLSMVFSMDDSYYDSDNYIFYLIIDASNGDLIKRFVEKDKGESEEEE